MRYSQCIVFFFIFLSSCSTNSQTKWSAYVDPFLGTGGHGHVYPGATVPFGMVQLSPDNGKHGWDWCSGYHYSSDTIAGFSHTHLSGTGIGDWCDISVLPMTNTSQLQHSVIKIPFSHQDEAASPGYYRVKLSNQVDCEFTATPRCGYHRYTFPDQQGFLRFDLGFAINWDACFDAGMQVLDDSTLIGYRFSTGWAKNQRLFFAARFSHPVQIYHFRDHQDQPVNSFATGPKVKAVLKFGQLQQALEVRVGLSSVGWESALQAIEDELKNHDFASARKKAENAWEKELSKIQVKSTDQAFLTQFYTALYRTCLAPNLYSDADGRYRHHSDTVKAMPEKSKKYTVFSLWDTFRALNPLHTITQPELVPEFMNSMLTFYDDHGLLPVWDLSTWETNTMTGYHAIPVLADAILKDFPGFDYKHAYTAMVKSAHQPIRGVPAYNQYGYLPHDLHGQSVTNTLEYAYDDWCIAQVARKLGKMEDYKLFSDRAMRYQNLFDAKTGFMRAKTSAGKFVEPFDPLYSDHSESSPYTEGTAWQHSFFVPHDVDGLAKLHGGKEKLAQKLDELFNASSELHGDFVSSDISGLIGQYAHGNEPSHHIIYMYSHLGHPEKAAQWLQTVKDSMYQSGPDGLSGNEDCGQMSAWLVWTALGFYPMNPASSQYVFGYPFIDEATLLLPNQKKLHITVKKELAKNKTGLRKALLNGQEIKTPYLTHQQLLQGGELTLHVYRN